MGWRIATSVEHSGGVAQLMAVVVALWHRRPSRDGGAQ
jgi:hypothetical protein